MINKETIEKEKKAVALKALEMIPNGAVVGLGSGSTVRYLIEELGLKKEKDQIDIKAVATSYDTLLVANKSKIPVLNLNSITNISLTIDGADQIDENGNAIKGKGGAQTCERIVASLSQYYILIVDETKIVQAFRRNSIVPVEILPQSLSLVQQKLKKLDCHFNIRVSDKKVGPVITDMGNIILDLHFNKIKDCELLDQELNNIPGVVGHGLFVNLVDQIIVGILKNGKIKTEIKTFEKNTNPI